MKLNVTYMDGLQCNERYETRTLHLTNALTMEGHSRPSQTIPPFVAAFRRRDIALLVHLNRTLVANHSSFRAALFLCQKEVLGLLWPLHSFAVVHLFNIHLILASLSAPLWPLSDEACLVVSFGPIFSRDHFVHGPLCLLVRWLVGRPHEGGMHGRLQRSIRGPPGHKDHAGWHRVTLCHPSAANWTQKKLAKSHKQQTQTSWGRLRQISTHSQDAIFPITLITRPWNGCPQWPWVIRARSADRTWVTNHRSSNQTDQACHTQNTI